MKLTCVIALLMACEIAAAQQATETVLHSFASVPTGVAPYGTPVHDLAGNLYGTTQGGGTGDAGVVYKLDTAGKYHVLYNFTGGADGANPYAGVVLDAAGNLYGTTYYGGNASDGAGKGVVYKVDPSGHETVLYTFTGGNDGGNPYAGIVLDSVGNLYGTTVYGGSSNVGVLYKLTPSGQMSVLHAFAGGSGGTNVNDGANPYGGVIFDTAGNLYGTTYYGGRSGFGTIYKLTPSGQETVLFAFVSTGNQGAHPQASMVFGRAGNLYGTASNVVFEFEANGTYKVLALLHYETTGGLATAGVTLDNAGNLYGTTVREQGRGASQALYGTVYKLSASGQLTVLYVFVPNEIGGGINSGVVLDRAGNVYGATSAGGLSGMIYELSAAGQETTLYSFSPALGGTTPRAGLIRDAAGNFYGTTAWGGPANAGVVYKLSPAGRETILYSFTGGTDGSGPSTANLAIDSTGNLYGTAVRGGTSGDGVVYRLSSSGSETVLYSFTGGADGSGPDGGVIRDPAGNLYGTTFAGGTSNAGTVFKLNPSGEETVLHSFTDGSDGGSPEAGVILDGAGNLYGTTFYGGIGIGVVYEVSADGKETVLYSFTGEGDGGNPQAGVIRDSAGNLYGTTVNGGGVYRLSPAGILTVLHAFTGGTDGEMPVAGLVRDPAGNLYGTTQVGGDAVCAPLGCGVVYKVTPAGEETILHSFTGGADGGTPYGGVIVASGTLYGTASEDGAGGGGVVYELTLAPPEE